jgi:hypothetical protein
VDAFKDVDLDRLKAASLFHQEPPKSTEAAGAVMQPMAIDAWVLYHIEGPLRGGFMSPSGSSASAKEGNARGSFAGR